MTSSSFVARPLTLLRVVRKPSWRGESLSPPSLPPSNSLIFREKTDSDITSKWVRFLELAFKLRALFPATVAELGWELGDTGAGSRNKTEFLNRSSRIKNERQSRPPPMRGGATCLSYLPTFSTHCQRVFWQFPPRALQDTCKFGGKGMKGVSFYVPP